MDPEIWAIPDVITVINSERVIRERKGRMVSGAVQALRPARAHHSAHQEGKRPHDELHDAEVVHDGKECADEDDGWQELKREDHPQLGVRLAQLAEDELGPDVGIIQYAGDEVAQRAKQLLSRWNPEHEDGEHHLEPQSPGHDPPADLTPVE